MSDAPFCYDYVLPVIYYTPYPIYNVSLFTKPVNIEKVFFFIIMILLQTAQCSSQWLYRNYSEFTK